MPLTSETSAVRTLAVGDLHEIDLPVRWGDMDALAHLNNTVYFRLMEEARMQILEGAGLKVPADDGPILAHASCDFVKPVTYPATVCVRHRVASLGRSSMTLDLELFVPGEPSDVYARGRNVLVWMDYRVNQSCPWPVEVLARLAAVMPQPRQWP